MSENKGCENCINDKPYILCPIWCIRRGEKGVTYNELS